MSSGSSNPSSLNFAFLACYSPLLDRLGAQAERYFKDDPNVEGLLTACVGVVESELESLQERNEVLAVTGLLASLRDRQRVTEFFRRRSMMNLLQQTPLFQELTRDIVLEAEQRGRIHTVLHQLEHKFGPLPEDVMTALQEITDSVTLDRLGLAVLDAPDLDTFRQQIPPAQN
ncbi:MAG: hypothetical protein H7Y22_07490 [Gemmatimonadaceae bacterium]|nr:hypothetical protein [Gloeobacterales cyanobacterium ES-bin-141]